MDYQLLVNKAKEAKENAYAPYSNFKVGAAVLLKDEHVVCGVNVENAAYGSTMCAERNAVFQAYSQGYRKEDIAALAIVGEGKQLITPCGACRQVLLELLQPHTPIILGHESYYEVTNIKELLPRSFSKENL